MATIKINTQNILSALFLLGYDKVDAYMFTAMMGELSNKSKNNEKSLCTLYNEEYECDLEFTKDDPFDSIFSKCITPYFGGYMLKENINLNTDISRLFGFENTVLFLEDYISSNNNKLLSSYINNSIDMNKIIIKKIITYGLENTNNYPNLFCNKEKEIIYNMFGTKDMHEKQEKSAKYTLSRRLEDDLK